MSCRATLRGHTRQSTKMCNPEPPKHSFLSPRLCFWANLPQLRGFLFSLLVFSWFISVLSSKMGWNPVLNQTFVQKRGHWPENSFFKKGMGASLAFDQTLPLWNLVSGHFTSLLHNTMCWAGKEHLVFDTSWGLLSPIRMKKKVLFDSCVLALVPFLSKLQLLQQEHCAHTAQLAEHALSWVYCAFWSRDLEVSSFWKKLVKKRVSEKIVHLFFGEFRFGSLLLHDVTRCFRRVCKKTL